MTREEIIDGLKFTVEMFLLDPNTGETFTEPRNDMDKKTIDACRGAIELLKQEPCDDCVSRQEAIHCVTETELYNETFAEAKMRIAELKPVLPKREENTVSEEVYTEEHIQRQKLEYELYVLKKKISESI